MANIDPEQLAKLGVLRAQLRKNTPNRSKSAPQDKERLRQRTTGARLEQGNKVEDRLDTTRMTESVREFLSQHAERIISQLPLDRVYQGWRLRELMFKKIRDVAITPERALQFAQAWDAAFPETAKPLEPKDFTPKRMPATEGDQAKVQRRRWARSAEEALRAARTAMTDFEDRRLLVRAVENQRRLRPEMIEADHSRYPELILSILQEYGCEPDRAQRLVGLWQDALLNAGHRYDSIRWHNEHSPHKSNDGRKGPRNLPGAATEKYVAQPVQDVDTAVAVRALGTLTATAAFPSILEALTLLTEKASGRVSSTDLAVLTGAIENRFAILGHPSGMKRANTMRPSAGDEFDALANLPTTSGLLLDSDRNRILAWHIDENLIRVVGFRVRDAIAFLSGGPLIPVESATFIDQAPGRAPELVLTLGAVATALTKAANGFTPLTRTSTGAESVGTEWDQVHRLRAGFFVAPHTVREHQRVLASGKITTVHQHNRGGAGGEKKAKVRQLR